MELGVGESEEGGDEEGGEAALQPRIVGVGGGEDETCLAFAALAFGAHRV